MSSSVKLEVITPPNPARTFVLTLDEETAHTLRDLLGAVGGHPDRTYRGDTDKILNVLAPYFQSSFDGRSIYGRVRDATYAMERA